jgi:hypothetical protein
MVGLVTWVTMLLPGGRAFAPWARRMAWLVKNEANAVTSATTRTTRPTTMSLAVSTVVRRDVADRVVRMEPVAYSEVTTRAPSTPTTNWERKDPVWLNRTGSKVARSARPSVPHRPASTLVTRAESPIPATTTMARHTQVERTERSFVHSERTWPDSPARPRSMAGSATGSATVVTSRPPPACARGSRPCRT